MPAPPTALTLSSSGVIQTGQDVHAFLNIGLTPPATPTWNTAPQYVEAYVFTYSYTSVSAVTRSVVLPFNSGNVYRLDPLPTGVSVNITAQTVDFSGQVSAASTALIVSTPTDTTAPAARTITATVLSGGGVLVNLDALNVEADFSSYELWRGEGTSSLTVVWGAAPIFTFFATAVEDRNIPTSAADYYYKVVSKDFSGNGATSNIVGPLTLVTTNVPPPPGPNLASGTATANVDGTITISWPGVVSAGLAGYRVWRRVHATTAWTELQALTAVSGSGTVSYTDNLLLNGTQYDYNVTAFNSAGDESALSATVLTATASDTTAPAAAGSITATGRTGSVYAVWTASTSADTVSYGVSFRLTPIAAYSTEVRVNANQFTIQGLTQTRDALANNLGIKVVAYDAANNGSVPSTYTVQFPDLAGYTPADATVPAGTASLAVTKNDDGSVLLSWPASVSVDRSGYQVEKYEAISSAGTRIQTTGGTDLRKYHWGTAVSTVAGDALHAEVWLQNNGPISVTVDIHLALGNVVVLPGALVHVVLDQVSAGGFTDFIFGVVGSVSSPMDITVFNPILTKNGTSISPSSDFVSGTWSAFSGAVSTVTQNVPILVNGFWDIEGTIQDDQAGTKTFRIGGLEPFSFRSKQYRFRVRTQDYSGNISSINQVEDPSFESGTTNSWTLSTDTGASATVSTATPNSGLNSLTANQAARPSQTLAVTGGAFYTWSAFMRSSGVTTILPVVRVEWYQTTGQASAIRTFDASTGVTPTTSYQRLSVSAAAPSDAAWARVYLYGDAANPTTTVLWDDAQFEQSSSPTAFNTTATGLINAIDQVAPLDYVNVNGSNLLNLTATGSLGTISIRWNLPPSTFSGAFDYIGGTFEIWRQVTTSAQPSLPVDAAFRKITTVPSGVGPATGTAAFINFDDLDPDEVFNVTASYKLKAVDRFGNISGFLNAGAAVSATSKTPNDIQIGRKDGQFPTAPTVSSTNAAVANTNGTITLTWTGSTTAGRNDLAGYHIYRQLNGAGAYVPIGDVFTNAEGGSQSWIDTGLDVGSTTYNYKVSAFDTGLEESTLSGASNVVTAIDNRVPSPPSLVTLKGQVGGLQLTWVKSPSQGITRYKVGIPPIAGQAGFVQDVLGTDTFIRLAGGPSASALQASSFYTNISVEALSISGGGRNNIVPDSTGFGQSWTLSGAITFTPNGGVNGGGKWVYTGTGAADSSFKVAKSQVFTVVPGQTYTLSGWIDATNQTASAPFWALYDPTMATQYGSGATQTLGVSGRVTSTITIPAGVTNVVVLADPGFGSPIVTLNQPLTFSNPQLELGSAASTYQATNYSGGVLAASAMPTNIIPDSDGTGGTWVGSIPFTPGVGQNGTGGFQVTGTGAAGGFANADSVTFNVVPGLTYILSGWFDGSHVTTTGYQWTVWEPTITTSYAGAFPAVGFVGRFASPPFTFPAGVTQARVICDVGNSTIASGQILTFSNPQLEIGSTATNYEASLPEMSAYVPIDTIAPSAPSGVTATAAPGGYATVTWTGSSSTDVFSYVVEMAQETALLSGTPGTWIGVGVSFAPTVAIQVGGLIPTAQTGLRYQFRVKAIDNSNNASAYATSAFLVAFTTSSRPTAISGVVPSGNIEQDASTTTAMISVSWNKNTDRDLAYYIVDYFRTDGVGGHSAVNVPTIQTSYTVRSLKIGVQYGFIVYAVDVYGQRSDPSIEQDITVSAPPPTNHQPGPPTASTPTVSGGLTNGIATLTLNFTVGFGGSSGNVSFPADNDLSYVSIRESTSSLAGTAVGTQAGTVNVSATAANGATGSFTKTVYRNSDNTSYTLFYKILMVDTSGSVSSPSSEVSVVVGGYNGNSDPSCPAVDMYRPEGATIEDAKEGDLFLCLEDGKDLGFREMQASPLAICNCVRLWTDNGCSVVVSDTTPMVLRDGSTIRAPQMEGHEAATLVDGRLEWSWCHVEAVPSRPVRHINLGGGVFAAGTFPDRCIFTHNVIPQK